MKLSQAIKESWKKHWRLGILVALTTWITAFIVTYLKLEKVTITASTIDVREQILSKGLAPSLGDEFLALFQGVFTVDLGSLIGLLIGSFTLVFIGRALVNWGAPQLKFLGKGMIGNMYSILFYGFIGASVLLWALTGFPLTVALLAMGIYYFIISILIAGLMQIGAIARWVK